MKLCANVRIRKDADKFKGENIPMKQKKIKLCLPYLMVTPAFLVMLLVVILPIINTVVQSFSTADGSFTLANYRYFLTSPEAFESLIFTLVESLSTMLLAVILSFFLAL